MAVRSVVVLAAIVFLTNFHAVVGINAGVLTNIATTAKETGQDQVNQMAMNSLKNSDMGRRFDKALGIFEGLGDTVLSISQVLRDTVDYVTSSITGEPNGPQLEKMIVHKLPLNSILAQQCLPEFKVDVPKMILIKKTQTTVTFASGNFYFDKSKFSVKGCSTGEAWDEFKVLCLSFNFNDMEFSYQIKTQSRFTFNSANLRVTVKGLSKLVVDVKVPNTMARLKLQAATGNCFLEATNVNIDLADKIEVDEFTYTGSWPPQKGFGLTESSFQNMLDDYKSKASREVREKMKAALMNILKPILKQDKIFCDPKQLFAVADPVCKMN